MRHVVKKCFKCSGRKTLYKNKSITSPSLVDSHRSTFQEKISIDATQEVIPTSSHLTSQLLPSYLFTFAILALEWP